jgi:malate dehydrogenase (oxaloacetate-decarboxylating)(NADP+)
MEGKAVLFKKFAGIDVFDIEVDERDPDKLIEIIASLEPTFGAINLEDIKAPECFVVERTLRERMSIPVFHDDQHGTAIIVAAAVVNGLRVVGKEIGAVKVVTSGAGAAALACLDQISDLGVPKDNITVCDRTGVIHEGRTEKMDPEKARYALATDNRTLAEALVGADIFLGLSGPNTVTQDMLKGMADKPLVYTLANPDPEIKRELAFEARPDAIIATGRSDYPNQVNNVLCFPFIFRGALDVGATTINDEMKRACVRAIADLATAEVSDVVARAYGGESLTFGPEYILPKPFDPRLVVEVPVAVAKAAMDSGVATRPVESLDRYREDLARFVYRSSLLMRSVFARGQSDPKRVVFAQGEEERVLRACQVVVDEGFAQPILIGRRAVLERRIERFGLRLRIGEDFELCDPEHDDRYNDYVGQYHQLMKRKGVTYNAAAVTIRTNFTVIASVMVARGEADALITGPSGLYSSHLRVIQNVLGLQEGVSSAYGMQVLILPSGQYFILDTQVHHHPSADQIAEMCRLAAAEVRRFGIEPRVAFVSHSNYGNSDAPSAIRMREAMAQVRVMEPGLMMDGEMHADIALSEAGRRRAMPDSPLEGQANLLIMPSLDAANISYNMAKTLGQGQSVGPVLIGPAKPAHIITPAISVRGTVNMCALAVVDAQDSAATTAKAAE